MSSALQAVKRFRVRELGGVQRQSKIPNPFLPHKNPNTGRWIPPKYSLRQQADLVKQARTSGTVHLLPSGPKLCLHKARPAVAPTTTPTTSGTLPESAVAKKVEWWRRNAVEWVGEFKEKEVKGADVGNRLYAGKKRMFKGHKWERTLEKRVRDRKMLMKDMKSRIERFRTTYRRKTPSPISLARPVSYSKLPF